VSILPEIRGLGKTPMGSNFVARLGAIASLTIASLLVARTGGPVSVGELALLRVLPWLAGVLTSFGVFGAAPYFLAGPWATDRRVRPTIVAITVVAGLVGTAAWVAAAPLLTQWLFPALSTMLVAAAGITVLTQLLESTAKACSQGLDDFTGSNRIIILEEALFVPAYLALVAMGVEYSVAIVGALIVGDVLTFTSGWVRLIRRGFLTDVSAPAWEVARKVLRYGFRAGMGTVLLLLNARLDVIIVGAIVGPAALGIYAVASRFAELLRLPALAVNYVLYPAYARVDAPIASVRAAEMMRRMGWLTVAAAVPLAIAATFVIPMLYGEAFRAAVVPSYILIVGLCGSGISGVITAYLYAAGRPGLSSLAIAAGLVGTVILDLLLIPTFGVIGAAVASAIAYMTTTIVLIACYRSVATSHGSDRATLEPSESLA
jgi:O-antigen/teichoic acid export membrane protein